MKIRKISTYAITMIVVAGLLVSCGGGGGGGGAAGLGGGTTTYTVTYNGNGNTGGNVPIDSTNYSRGQVVTVLGNTGSLAKSGYTFAGWNTQADGSGTTYTQAQTFTMESANVTLYANWTKVVPVPDTGQTTCYDSNGNSISCTGTGQDGAYAIHPPSYTNNGDGTITDNVTGLTWQKCTNGLSGSGCSGTATTYNWYQAAGIYDATYNNTSTNVCVSLSLAGTGWRLPTDYELTTIVDFGTWGPAINAAYFPNTQSTDYWSLMSNVGTNGVWGVDFSYGSMGSSNYVGTFYVRCVRGQHSFNDYFQDNGNGTVTDITTNLMWQKCPDGLSGTPCSTGTATTVTWDNAITYCEGLSLGGFTDWRLPNVKELKSIADMTTYNPAINTTYFPNTASSNYWSSTTLALPTTSAWGVLFNSGGTGNYSKSNAYYVRCVRGQ